MFLLEDDQSSRVQFYEHVLNEEREGNGVLNQGLTKLLELLNRYNCVYRMTLTKPLKSGLNQSVIFWGGLTSKINFDSEYLMSP